MTFPQQPNCILELKSVRRDGERGRAYHGNERVQQLAVPEPVLPRALRRHCPRVIARRARGDFSFAQRWAVVLRQNLALEARAVRRRVELARLLEDDGLAVGAVVRGVSDADGVGGDGGRADDAPPERALEGQQEARDDALGSHGGMRGVGQADAEKDTGTRGYSRMKARRKEIPFPEGRNALNWIEVQVKRSGDGNKASLVQQLRSF